MKNTGCVMVEPSVKGSDGIKCSALHQHRVFITCSDISLPKALVLQITTVCTEFSQGKQGKHCQQEERNKAWPISTPFFTLSSPMEWIRQAHTANCSSGWRMTNAETEEKNHTYKARHRTHGKKKAQKQEQSKPQTKIK